MTDYPKIKHVLVTFEDGRTAEITPDEIFRKYRGSLASSIVSALTYGAFEVMASHFIKTEAKT